MLYYYTHINKQIAFAFRSTPSAYYAETAVIPLVTDNVRVQRAMPTLALRHRRQPQRLATTQLPCTTFCIKSPRLLHHTYIYTGISFSFFYREVVAVVAVVAASIRSKLNLQPCPVPARPPRTHPLTFLRSPPCPWRICCDDQPARFSRATTRSC